MECLTLPQTIYLWVNAQEARSNESVRDFSLRAAAIGAALSGDKGQMAYQRIIAELSGPELPKEMSEAEKRFRGL